MTELKLEAEPAEAGLDARRLARADRMLARYVDDGVLPGWLLVVTRRGKVVHLSTYGHRDVEAGLPVETGTQWRIYSMTKPVTSVAAMILYEEGAFELTDPVSRFVPAFAEPRVYTGGSHLRPVTEPAREPIRIWHLLTHTAGLTYGFHLVHPVDAMYRALEAEWGPDRSLAERCEGWAGLPLLFHPGAEWTYSVATDVLGRVIEVASGQPLDAFLQARVLGPLGMADTTFGPAAADRLAAFYTLGAGATLAGKPGRKAVRNDAATEIGAHAPGFLSGGGGLVSTAGDYHRFTQMLLRGGELDGVRLLGSRTLAYMTRNHLPGGVDLQTYGRPLFAESPFRGVGFGLGFGVTLDPVAVKVLGTAGEFSWGGAAGTAFWVDPAEELTAMFFTQLLAGGTLPIRPQLRKLVYQAIVD